MEGLRVRRAIVPSLDGRQRLAVRDHEVGQAVQQAAPVRAGRTRRASPCLAFVSQLRPSYQDCV